MSKCELAITTERETYHPGDVVTGTVSVEVDAEVQCSGLTLTRLWRTHGKGNPSSGAEERVTLFEGIWRAGERQEYPFTLTLPPEGPLTYHGQCLNLDWYLEAQADVPWAEDPAAQAGISVELGEEVPEAFARAGEGKEPAVYLQGQGEAGPHVGACLGIAFALGGLALLRAAFSGSDFGTGCVGSCFTLLGLGIAFFTIRAIVTLSKLGPVRATAEPQRIRPGEAIEVTLSFAPRKPLTVNTITAKLHGCERVTSGFGDKRRIHTHTFYEEELVLCSERSLSTGEGIELSGSLQLPEDAVFSVPGLTWELSLDADLADLTDWTQTFYLDVGPWRR